MRLLCGRFNGGNAGNHFRVRFSLFPLFRLDIVYAAFDVSDFRQYHTGLLRILFAIPTLISSKGQVAENDRANGSGCGKY